MLARWLLVVSGVAGLLIFGAASFVDWGASIVVRDADGRVVSHSPLPDSGEFEIEYVHSYYEAPAIEHFVAEEEEGFRLVGISSPSEAVLDYYELEGHKEPGGDLLRLVPDEPQRFDTLPLIGTEKGRKTIVLPGRRVPLYQEDGPAHLALRVEEDPLFMELCGLLNG
jgi:hypothetical protein